MLRARTLARRAIPAPVRQRASAVRSQRQGQHWVDNWRFTPNGLSAGLEPINVSSCGNTWCIRRNHRCWAICRPWHRVLSPWALRKAPLVPQVVRAFAIQPRSTAPAE